MEHLQCVVRILRYVRDTMDRGLLHRVAVIEQLVGYTYVDWSGTVGNCRSTSGYVFSLGSVTIAWRSKKQLGVILSSNCRNVRNRMVQEAPEGVVSGGV